MNKDEPLMSDQIIDHYTGHDDYDPPYCRDPDYIDDLRDPLRAATGILRMTVIAILFWATLIGIVLAANHYIGGG